MKQAPHSYVLSPLTVDPDDYNDSLDRFFAEYEGYLKTLPKLYEKRDRTVALSFVLDNSGTGSADDVDVILQTEAKGVFGYEKPFVPSPPAPPKKERYFVDFPASQFLNNRNIFAGAGQRGNVQGPSLFEKKPLRAKFNVQRIKPGLPDSLPLLYFTFESLTEAKSFSVEYQMAGNNLRKALKGKLHVKINEG